MTGNATAHRIVSSTPSTSRFTFADGVDALSSVPSRAASPVTTLTNVDSSSNARFVGRVVRRLWNSRPQRPLLQDRGPRNHLHALADAVGLHVLQVRVADRDR